MNIRRRLGFLPLVATIAVRKLEKVRLVSILHRRNSREESTRLVSGGQPIIWGPDHRGEHEHQPLNHHVSAFQPRRTGQSRGTSVHNGGWEYVFCQPVTFFYHAARQDGLEAIDHSHRCWRSFFRLLSLGHAGPR